MRYELVGIETNNFLKNAGTLLWLMIGWIILVAIHFILKIFSQLSPKTKKVAIWLRNRLFYSLILRLLVESYLELTVAALLNFKDVSFIQNLTIKVNQKYFRRHNRFYFCPNQCSKKFSTNNF